MRILLLVLLLSGCVVRGPEMMLAWDTCSDRQGVAHVLGNTSADDVIQITCNDGALIYDRVKEDTNE